MHNELSLAGTHIQLHQGHLIHSARGTLDHKGSTGYQACTNPPQKVRKHLSVSSLDPVRKWYIAPAGVSLDVQDNEASTAAPELRASSRGPGS